MSVDSIDGIAPGSASEDVTPIYPGYSIGNVAAPTAPAASDPILAEAGVVSPSEIRISETARELAAAYLREQTARAAVAATVADRERVAEDSNSVREMMEQMRDYDNSVAVNKYVNYLRTAALYGNLNQIAGLTENAANFASGQPLDPNAGQPGVNQPGNTLVRQQIDQWVAGNGVYLPGFAGQATTDGFTFTPLSEEAQLANNAADVLAGNNRDLIVNYLTRLSQLTPLNFIFYDPTGLGPLSIIERRDFLNTAGQLIEDAHVPEVYYINPADMVFEFNPDGTMEFTMQWEVPEEFHETVLEVLNHGNGPQDAGQVAKLRQYGRRISTFA